MLLGVSALVERSRDADAEAKSQRLANAENVRTQKSKKSSI